MTEHQLGISFRETNRGLKESPKWYYWGFKNIPCGSCGKNQKIRYYKQKPKYKGQRVHHRGWNDEQQ